MPNYTCDAVNNAFIAFSGYLSPTIQSKVAPNQRPWFISTPRSKWEEGMGVVHNSILWERTVPTDTGLEWTDSNFSDNTSNPTVDRCLMDPEIVHFGQSQRSMHVQRRNIQTEEFCVEDFRDDFQIGKTLDGVARNLTWITNYVWESRIRHEYIRVSDHKVTEGAVFDLGATAFDPANPPTSTLTLGTLEQIFNWLLLDGAAVEGAVGSMSGGRPVFDLMTDFNTSRDLIRQDPLIREDFRYAYMGKGVDSPLLGALGSEVAYDGFRHVYDPFPERYDIEGGVYVRRYPYKDPSTATKGVKQDLDPRYLYAAFQISEIKIPSVMMLQIPEPISMPGGGLKFDPVNYMGDFQWLNIKDKKCNPRGTKGFFDAVFASATDPGLTHHGFAIMHKNCPPLRKLRTSCYS